MAHPGLIISSRGCSQTPQELKAAAVHLLLRTEGEGQGPGPTSPASRRDALAMGSKTILALELHFGPLMVSGQQPGHLSVARTLVVSSNAVCSTKWHVIMQRYKSWSGVWCREAVPSPRLLCRITFLTFQSFCKSPALTHALPPSPKRTHKYFQNFLQK